MELLDRTDAASFLFYDSPLTRMDEELAEAIEAEFEYTVGPGYSYEFQISEEDFYKVLSVVDAQNAPVLIQMGLNTPRAVLRFLEEHHLEDLIRNNMLVTESAFRAEVPVNTYIEMYPCMLRGRDGHERLMRGIQEYSTISSNLSYCRNKLIPHLVAGVLRYEDVHALGYPLIEENHHYPEFISTMALMKDPEHRASKNSYGPEDIKSLILKHQASADRKAALKLLVSFGAETALKITNPDLINRIAKSYEKETFTASFALFIDSVNTEMNRLNRNLLESVPLPAKGILKRLHDAGVDPLFAAGHFVSSEWNVQTIIALHDGVTLPLTEGWL